jgi:hypothetical protein
MLLNTFYLPAFARPVVLLLLEGPDGGVDFFNSIILFYR